MPYEKSKRTDTRVYSFENENLQLTDYIVDENARLVCMPVNSAMEIRSLSEEEIAELQGEVNCQIVIVRPSLLSDGTTLCYEVPLETEALCTFRGINEGKGFANDVMKIFQEKEHLMGLIDYAGVLPGENNQLIILDRSSESI